jgi:hypothetical protein
MESKPPDSPAAGRSIPEGERAMRRFTSSAMFMTLLFVGAGALNAQEKPPVTPHDMAGKENCAMCHAEGVMGATKMPASHEGFDKANCQLCHSAESPMQSAAVKAIPHELEGKENCAMCHAEGVMGAAKMPENHGDAVKDKCDVCHKPAG